MQCFFWSHPRCFGPLGKFQHNIKISIKTAHVSRLFVSCDYGWTNTFRSVKRRLRNKLTNVTGLWSQERIWYPTQATIIKFKSHSFKESVYHERKKIKNIKIKIKISLTKKRQKLLSKVHQATANIPCNVDFLYADINDYLKLWLKENFSNKKVFTFNSKEELHSLL